MVQSVNSAVMNEVRKILLDPSGAYWTDQYLIDAYNIVVAAIIGENPTALTKVINFHCATGVDQVLPSDAVGLLKVPANVSGRTIRQVSPEMLEEDDENWYGAPRTAEVAHVVNDQFDPLRFRVWPPNDGTGVINLQYAYAPDDITALTDNFTLTEAYRMDVRNGILGMAYALNTDRQDLTKAQFYTGQLQRGISARVNAQLALLGRPGATSTTE